MEDDYEGNFETRRALIYTFTFTAKVYLFGPITDVTGDIIKKVTIGYVASSTDGTVATRDLTYQVTPRATKDYDGSVITNLTSDIQLDDTAIQVDNGGAVERRSYIYIGQEEMFVEKVVNNTLTVKRGQDNTTAQPHVGGSPIHSITKADDKLIEFGDDFGFNANVF